MRTLLFAPVLALCCSCASIISSGPDVIPVNSAPPGATVKLDGMPSGVTPTVLVVSRSAGGMVTLELAGHAPYTQKIRTKLNVAFLGNFIFGGLFGMLIDVVSGNATVWTGSIFATLQPLGTPALEEPGR